MDIRDTILRAVEIKTGGVSLEDLLPEEYEKEYLDKLAEGLEDFKGWLVTLPQGKWPEPMGMSIVFGNTQGLIFDTQSGMGQSAYVHGFSRGVAAVATILDTRSLAQLQELVTKAITPVAIGDADLPPVAPWLRRALLESAVNITEKTDNYNLRDVLAFNYGLFWATASIVPPEPKGRQKSALVWVKNVAEYFGSLGVVPE